MTNIYDEASAARTTSRPSTAPHRDRRARIAAVLCALLVSATAVVVLAGPAAAVPPPPTQTCTAWTQVPFTNSDQGYVNDRHGIVAVELQHCSATPGGPLTQYYVRAIYQQIGIDTWTNPPNGLSQRGIVVGLRESDGACSNCTLLWETPLIPEPGIGLAVIGDRILTAPGRQISVQVQITYVNPPNPNWFQIGSFRFVVPAN